MPKKKHKLKGDLIVIEFKDYMKQCDYLWKHKEGLNMCAYYGRDGGIVCRSDLCPIVYLHLSEIIIEPYERPKKLAYID